MIDRQLSPIPSRTPTLRHRNARRVPLVLLVLGLGTLIPGAFSPCLEAQSDDTTTPATSTPPTAETTTAETTTAGPPSTGGASAEVVVIRIQSAIHPMASEFLRESLTEADARGATALVVELNTPGGLLTSTREMTEAMLQARTPVVVYVAPNGARAASAGFFLLMASDVAAMAPGTNSGAAHPVSGQGEDIEGDMRKKVEEDTTAMIRSLASQNGRNVELAQAAVLESRSFTAEEALENGLIEVVAPSLEQLLIDIDGRLVEKPGQPPRILATAGAPRLDRQMTAVQQFLASLAEPQIAALLMLIGILGIYMEWSNPGIIVPGMVGAICLILGFYALSVLPINFAGVALILLALVLFVLESQIPTFGILTAGGAISLILGALMLFKDKQIDPNLRVQVEMLVAVAAFVALVMAALSWKAIAVRRLPARTGVEGLVGERGVARSALEPRGKVFVHGEYWHASSETPVPEGRAVEVLKVEGLELRVRPLEVPEPATTSVSPKLESRDD